MTCRFDPKAPALVEEAVEFYQFSLVPVKESARKIHRGSEDFRERSADHAGEDEHQHEPSEHASEQPGLATDRPDGGETDGDRLRREHLADAAAEHVRRREDGVIDLETA